MRPSPSPVVPTWLLERLLSGPGREALIGDLVEQLAARRSRLWFWRQAATAIAADSTREIPAHKVLAIRAFFTGLVTLLVLDVDPWLVDLAVRAGLVDSPTWPSTRYLLASLACLEFLAAGWVIGRLHRPHQGAMVVGIAGLVMLLRIPRLVQVTPNAFEHLRFLSYFVESVALAILTPLAVIVGGALSAPRPRLDMEGP